MDKSLFRSGEGRSTDGTETVCMRQVRLPELYFRLVPGHRRRVRQTVQRAEQEVHHRQLHAMRLYRALSRRNRRGHEHSRFPDELTKEDSSAFTLGNQYQNHGSRNFISRNLDLMLGNFSILLSRSLEFRRYLICSAILLLSALR